MNMSANGMDAMPARIQAQTDAKAPARAIMVPFTNQAQEPMRMPTPINQAVVVLMPTRKPESRSSGTWLDCVLALECLAFGPFVFKDSTMLTG